MNIAKLVQCTVDIFLVKMGKQLVFIFLTAISALILYRIYLLATFMRLSHNHVLNHYPGPCQLVKGVDIGSEDIELLPNGLVLMSTGLQAEPDAMPSRTGKSTILMLDLNKSEEEPVAMAVDIEWGNGKPEKAFFFHGLSSWTLDKENVIVFAVCHEKSGESVLRFRINLKTRKLYHLETIKDENFFNVNDVAATGERSFYFTNFIYYQRLVMKFIEFLLHLPLGSVGYYDGKQSKLVVTGMDIPNGIVISANQRSVIVAETGEYRIIEFTRDAKDDLTTKMQVNLRTSPDNLNWNHQSGQLLVGCHPIPWMIYRHVISPDKYTPSQVIALQTEGGHITDNMTQLLSTTGSDISGSSSAVIYKNRLFIGTVMHKALVCEMVYPKPSCSHA